MHARSVVGCGLDRETGEVSQRRVTPSREEVGDWIRSLPAPAVVVYEAGFGLARYLIDAGIECVVAAPSKLQRPSGDRVKTDLRVMPGIWRGCCIWVRLWRWPFPPWSRKPPATWCVRVRIAAVT